MSFYDNTSEYSLWKQQPNSPTGTTPSAADCANNNNNNNNNNTNYMNSNAAASSPSYNYNVNINNIYNSTEIVVTENTNNYTTNTEHNNFHGDFGNASAGINSYFNNNSNLNLDSHAATTTINNNANQQFTNNNNNPMEEELQVVPDSLDHLSRDELCRMIYRLDYERNTLQHQLTEALLRNHTQQQLTSSVVVKNDNTNDNGPKKKKKKGKKKRSRSCSGTLKNDGEDQACKEIMMQEGGVIQLLAVEEEHVDPFTVLDTPPTPSEIEEVQKHLGENVFTAVKSALHGGRKIPKSTITMKSISLSMISAIMEHYQDKKSSETKRMIKWTLPDDKDISKLLKSERLVHPVKHDGTGHILPSGSSPSNIYQWAKFVSMEVKYDKSSNILTLIGKTTSAGSGRPENVPEMVRYSSSEQGGGEGVVEEDGRMGQVVRSFWND